MEKLSAQLHSLSVLQQKKKGKICPSTNENETSGSDYIKFDVFHSAQVCDDDFFVFFFVVERTFPFSNLTEAVLAFLGFAFCVISCGRNEFSGD